MLKSKIPNCSKINVRCCHKPRPRSQPPPGVITGERLPPDYRTRSAIESQRRAFLLLASVTRIDREHHRPARTFRQPSGEFAARVKADPTLPLIHLSNVIANQGALPIKVGDDILGAAGASGAPGGEKDEACIKAGLDKVADQLK